MMLNRFLYLVLVFLSPTLLAKCLLTIAAPNEVQILSKEIQLLHQAYQSVGCDFKLTTMPAKRAIHQANKDNLIDGELIRYENFSDQVTDFISVPTPIYMMQVYAFSKTKQPSHTYWANLKPFKVAAVRGFIAIEQQLKEHPDLVLVNSAAQAFELLEKNNVDIVVVPAPLQKFATFKIETLQPALAEQPLYHFIHKRNQHLIAPLNRAILNYFPQSEAQLP